MVIWRVGVVRVKPVNKHKALVLCLAQLHPQEGSGAPGPCRLSVPVVDRQVDGQMASLCCRLPRPQSEAPSPPGRLPALPLPVPVLEPGC